MILTPDEQEERIQEIIREVGELDGAIPENVVWDALRVAYQRGYHDGLEMRAETTTRKPIPNEEIDDVSME
jgi:hypothetical protein